MQRRCGLTILFAFAATAGAAALDYPAGAAL
jgi:hypothetical protein